MGYELNRLGVDASGLSDETLRERIGRLRKVDAVRFRRLWAYYRNPIRVCGMATESTSDRPYRQAQEWGLPPRITAIRSAREPFSGEGVGDLQRKEVVIENDIGWRIDAMVDYLMGKPLVIESTAPDAERRREISELTRAIIAHNGGMQFLQQLALMGAVYGFVDVLVKLDPNGVDRCDATPTAVQDLGQPAVADAPREQRGDAPARTTGASGRLGEQTDAGASKNSRESERLARMIRLEIVEPARALPVLCEQDWGLVEAYGQCYQMKRKEGPRPAHNAGRGRWWERLLRSAELFLEAAPAGEMLVTEIISPTAWQRYEDERLVAEGPNALGRIPLVHIQNTAVPFEYSGTSDVEGLMPLQDELNTRLSDRASRITLQSFKMYLGKCVEGFADLPIGPGRMWATDNPDADVVQFGGDADCPSESLHIADLREALDKSSGVSPIAAGAIKNRIGRLTSAAALRITLISLLAKTDKKRTTYGQGIQRMIELALAWLDTCGAFATRPEERGVELHWPSPLPENDVERLQEAEIKARLGVAKDVVLRELGY